MPQCKALRTFESKYGFIRAGSPFSAEKGYAVELASRGLIEILPDTLEPARNQALPGPPAKKESPVVPPPASDPNAAGQAAAGSTKPSVLSRAGQALRRRTAPPSRGDAKRSS